ncbi:MAG TPA: transposase [Planctomycetota bacterium]|nr:transposase [Planctomycetota bacterium]
MASPQSFGSLLNHHPHIHTVSSLGVFDKDGAFHPVPEDTDFASLDEIFREHTFKALLKKEVITEERVAMLRTWRHSGFNLDASHRVPAEDRAGLESLLEYMERAPVALERRAAPRGRERRNGGTARNHPRQRSTVRPPWPPGSIPRGGRRPRHRRPGHPRHRP